MKVLVVEDESAIADLIELYLRRESFEVVIEADGAEGLKKAQSEHFDLLILDVGLPHIDGTEICRTLRAQEVWTPIIFCTARDEEVDRVVGLELGADDYITKPFSPREFIARVKAVMRRTRETQAAGPSATAAGTDASITVGEINIDQVKRRVYVAGDEADLTSKEYELLVLLASHPGQAFNREQLLERVWGYNHEGYNHTVNSHINRLRAKIEPDPAHPRYVETVWGYGYRFAEHDQED